MTHSSRVANRFLKYSCVTEGDDQLFNYTTGRWLCNDHIRAYSHLKSYRTGLNWSCNLERSRRYLRFDVDALRKIAAKACDAEECISVRKIAEGAEFYSNFSTPALTFCKDPSTESFASRLMTVKRRLHACRSQWQAPLTF